MKQDNVADFDIVPGAMNQLYGISSGDFTLLNHRQIKSIPPAGYHSLAHICATEFGSKLLTWHARLLHHQDRRPEAKLVSNIDNVFVHTLRRDVLSQHPPWHLQPRVGVLPEAVMFGGIRVNRFVDAAMN